MTNNISSNLFAGPSFVEGMARVLDMGGTLQKYNTSKGEKKADTKAIKNDWNFVGKDLKMAINKYEQEMVSR